MFLLRFMRLKLSHERFAERFGLTLGAVNDQEQSRLIPLEEGNRRKIVGRLLAARLATRFPYIDLIAAASDRRRRPTGRSAALPLN